VTELLRIY